MTQPKFQLGRILSTPGALEAMAQTATNPGELLNLHSTGYWGAVDEEDWQANDNALVDGTRILSAYKLPDDTHIWIITEADRSVTTFLLPSEY